MYYIVVTALMFIFPLFSVAVDASINHSHFGLLLIGKWFVFWAVGIRLLLAGLRQIVQPRYTAEKIFGIKGNDALLVVRELGFANVAIGATGVISIFFTGWVVAAALAGGIFYGLAGVNHAAQRHRNKLENMAMVSDLFIASLLLIYCSWAVLQ